MGFFSRKKKTAQKPIAWTTPEERAASVLSVALAENDGAEDDNIIVLNKDLKRLSEKAPAKNAEMPPPPVEEPRSAREKLRALVVTAEASVCAQGSVREAEYAALSEYMDELHVIVLTLRRRGALVPRRIAPNVWVYPTNSRSVFFSIRDAYRIAKKQLAFGTGFRADVVAATDPFESGVAGYRIARAEKSPFAIHVSVDPFLRDFADAAPGNKWRVFSARFLLPRADCLVARSKRLGEMLWQRYREKDDCLAVLPPFHDLSRYRDATPVDKLSKRYPQMKFVLLAATPLSERGRAEFVIDTCAPIARQYGTVGLVIVGDGALYGALEKKVRDAGLSERIIFERDADTLASYMKSANLFLNVTADEEHDVLLAASAAAGLPVLTVASPMAEMLFEDNVSGFLCPENDMVCLQARIGEFLTDNQLRIQFSMRGREKVFAVVPQDVEAYRVAFVGSFESCVILAHTKKQET